MCGRGGMADAQDSDSCPNYGGVGSSPIDRINFIPCVWLEHRGF